MIFIHGATSLFCIMWMHLLSDSYLQVTKFSIYIFAVHKGDNKNDIYKKII